MGKKIRLLASIMVIGILLGCEEMNNRVEEQLDNINEHALDIDSAVNKGLDHVEGLDSTINARTKDIRDLDSMVRNTTTRIDSLVNKNTEEINRRINY